MYKVFLVDDEPFILDGLYDAVDWSSYGLELTGRAGNGKQALEWMKEVPVDILITDITMPVMNGLELIAAARQQYPELKIIILSGYNEFDYLKQGMKLGIENYLLKPINFTELTETLRNTVEKLDAETPATRGPVFTDDEIGILKDNILYRWMTGQIAPDELAERARMLGIVFEWPFLLASLVRPDDEDEKRVLELRREIKQRVAAERSTICFTNLEGDIVIVFMGDSPEACKLASLDLLTRLRSELGESYRSRISLGMVKRIGDEHEQSYEQARRAQEYFLMLGRTDIAEYETLIPDRSAQLPQIPVDWSDLGRLMVAKDKEQLFTRIEEEFHHAQKQEGITPALLRSLAIEMMLRLKMELNDLKSAQAMVSGLYKDVIGKASHASDVAELIALVQEAAEMMIDILGQDDRSPIVKQVLSHIHEFYMEEMSLKSLGRQYNIHPGYLGKLFHKETNETFTDYMNKYRIQQAKEMLKNTTMKVHEIARAVGYWETGYFHKQFKKYVGISPTDYKGLL
ncbi:response regulator transcription factor [Paenibacillus nasutitermitis]|uniref:DNA-binding response regulator n=1 Tax=Paenibacillus nasutitermitis TaxID=1652958 RepID=A0A916ZCB0_9BACL|nr:response regulator transcription factor [Paenibacillus nasutitermitis]GGD88031.1 DNA-binding response regulator [Paenibacillus nasutitermitis]